MPLIPGGQDPRAQALFQALANARAQMQQKMPGGQFPQFNMQDRLQQLRQQHPGAFGNPGQQHPQWEALLARLRERFPPPFGGAAGGGDQRQMLAQKLAEMRARYNQARSGRP